MKNFNFILQAKGGVGKSFFTYLHALQRQDDANTLFVDIDNSTHTSARQLAFLNDQNRVATISLFNERDKLDRQRLLQVLIELAAQPFSDFFLDFGAPESEQFPAMLRLDCPVKLLQEVEQHLQSTFTFHCVIAGNTAFKSCFEYLIELANQLYPTFLIQVHLNEYSLAGPSAQEQKKTLTHFCQQHNLPLKTFGDIDCESDVGKQIVHNATKGKGLNEFGFIEKLLIGQELAKL